MMMKRVEYGFNTKFSFFILVFLCTVMSREVFAERPLAGTLTTTDPRAVGLSGTLRASASGTSAVYLNPACLAMTPLYHIGLMYQYTGQDKMHTGGIAIVDAVTTIVAAGLAFNYSGINQSHFRHDSFDGRLALAGGIGDVLYLGATARYLHLKQNESSSGWGPAGVAALPSSGSMQANGLTFDVGAAVRLGQIFTMGIVGYNLTNTGSIYAPIELGFGASAHLMDMLLIEANGLVDFTSYQDPAWEVRLGGELFLAQRVALRVGYAYDVFFNTHAVSAGAGYVDRQFAIDVGFMHEIVEEGRMILTFGFKYFVN